MLRFPRHPYPAGLQQQPGQFLALGKFVMLLPKTWCSSRFRCTHGIIARGLLTVTTLHPITVWWNMEKYPNLDVGISLRAGCKMQWGEWGCCLPIAGTLATLAGIRELFPCAMRHQPEKQALKVTFSRVSFSWATLQMVGFVSPMWESAVKSRPVKDERQGPPHTACFTQRIPTACITGGFLQVGASPRQSLMN